MFILKTQKTQQRITKIGWGLIKTFKAREIFKATLRPRKLTKLIAMTNAESGKIGIFAETGSGWMAGCSITEGWTTTKILVLTGVSSFTVRFTRGRRLAPICKLKQLAGWFRLNLAEGWTKSGLLCAKTKHSAEALACAWVIMEVCGFISITFTKTTGFEFGSFKGCLDGLKKPPDPPCEGKNRLNKKANIKVIIEVFFK